MFVVNLSHHNCASLWRASANSSSGVLSLFVTKPCNKTIIPSFTQKRARAIRPRNLERTSLKPGSILRTTGMPLGQPNCTITNLHQ